MTLPDQGGHLVPVHQVRRGRRAHHDHRVHPGRQVLEQCAHRGNADPGGEQRDPFAKARVTGERAIGAFDRHPGLRVGIVELSSIWVPLYLRMLDGGWEFTSALNGETPSKLTKRPSEYFRNQVRVSAFSYEQPSRLMSASGDVFMCCSDYPHSEGTASPLADYAGSGGPPGDALGFYRDNIGVLLGD